MTTVYSDAGAVKAVEEDSLEALDIINSSERVISESLRADLVPASYRSEALAEALVPRVAGHRVLLARADRGRAVLREELERVARVGQVAVYRNADAE